MNGNTGLQTLKQRQNAGTWWSPPGLFRAARARVPGLWHSMRAAIGGNKSVPCNCSAPWHGSRQGVIPGLTWSSLSSGRAGQQPLCHSLHCFATCVALTTWTLTGHLVPWLNSQGPLLDGSAARCQGLMCELFIRAPYLMENPQLLQGWQNKSRCNLPLLQSAPRHVWEWLLQLSSSNPKWLFYVRRLAITKHSQRGHSCINYGYWNLLVISHQNPFAERHMIITKSVWKRNIF